MKPDPGSHRRLHGLAITAALLAAVIAFPFSAAGQAPAGTAAIQADGRIPISGAAAQHVQQEMLRSCLRHDICPGGRDGLDRSILFSIRGWDGTPARIIFGAADASAYPVFVAAPVTMWSAVLADGLPAEDAVAGSIALVAGFGTTMALKRLVGRSRPYAAIPGFRPRSGHTGTRGLSESASFPSGHATLAGSVAAGAAILVGHPAATAAAGVWAASVSASRIWLGVHYPTDVAAGLLIGTGATVLSMFVLR